MPIKMKPPSPDLLDRLQSLIFGQNSSLVPIVDAVTRHRVGLSPESRPAGVFLLLGPTGSGKTRTVEALAQVLHGTTRHLLRVDCGEFQMEHEVAKLIGAPPGYLGHRETHPILTQNRLMSVTSERSPLALILFDEIEKAAPSMQRLLLGILDRGALRLGDGSSVVFEHTLIFMTSNLGARERSKALAAGMGFPGEAGEVKHAGISMRAAKKRFSPEFMNRIDEVLTYEYLRPEDLRKISMQEMIVLQDRICTRLGARQFRLEMVENGFDWLVKHGTSREYGARELKRLIDRQIARPLALLMDSGKVPPRCTVRIDVHGGELRVRPRVTREERKAA